MILQELSENLEEDFEIVKAATTGFRPTRILEVATMGYLGLSECLLEGSESLLGESEIVEAATTDFHQMRIVEVATTGYRQ